MLKGAICDMKRKASLPTNVIQYLISGGLIPRGLPRKKNKEGFLGDSSTKIHEDTSQLAAGKIHYSNRNKIRICLVVRNIFFATKTLKH